MRIRPAAAGDLARVRQLLVASHLPVDGVAENFGHFIVAEKDDSITGVVGMEHYGDVALLRSAAVSAEARSNGIGGKLVSAILDDAGHRGVREVYLLTTTASEYFPRFGFTAAPRAEAPQELRASREFQGACPDTAILMKYTLAGKD